MTEWTRRWPPRRCGPLSTWRQARETCRPDCFGRHGTWPLLRGLGVVPSPRWHTAWYRQLLLDAATAWHRREAKAARRTDRPMAIVVVNPEDHLLVARLVALAPPVARELHVLSQCLTPLRAIERWADRHDQVVTVHHCALARRTGPFDLGIVADDSVDVGRVREEERASSLSLVPVVDSLAPGAQLAYATRLGPSVMMQHTAEYAGLVRCVQSAAGVGWRHRTPTRRQVASDRWCQPTPLSVHYQSVGIESVLGGAGLTNVDHDLDIHERPSRLLRWHPSEITLGAGSQMLRFTGAAPDDDPPATEPTTTSPMAAGWG